MVAWNPHSACSAGKPGSPEPVEWSWHKSWPQPMFQIRIQAAISKLQFIEFMDSLNQLANNFIHLPCEKWHFIHPMDFWLRSCPLGSDLIYCSALHDVHMITHHHILLFHCQLVCISHAPIGFSSFFPLPFTSVTACSIFLCCLMVCCIARNGMNEWRLRPDDQGFK